MNVIEDETVITIKLCSFFNRLCYVKEKIYINNTSNLVYKNTVYRSFHENLRKIFLTHFVSHFLTNRGKIENEDEKTWENDFDY